MSKSQSSKPNEGRINNPESCICCGRRADGLAVGKPNHLGWYCYECGPDLAKEAVAMKKREFDIIEQRAIKSVAAMIGTEPITLDPKEAPDFMKWLIEEFSQAMRREIEGGSAPF